MSPAPEITEAEYRADLRLLSTEIENAATIYHTHEELNRLVLDDEQVFRVVNEDALFWRSLTHSLQTALFMTLSRIFDTAGDAHSIHTVVNATLRHLDWFSRDALKARRTRGNFTGSRVEDFLDQSWFPQHVSELRSLKRELTKYAHRFTEVYLPIRNKVFAHRLIEDDHAGATIFQKTNRTELGEMVDFLHDLIDGLQQLYDNGDRPTLGKRSYKDHNQRIRKGLENVLRKVIAGSGLDRK